MNRQRVTLSLVVVLAVSLSACVKENKQAGPLVKAPSSQTSAQKTAPRCPTVTSEAAETAILEYLERSNLDDPGLDALATEWERLNDGAKTCRTGKAPL